MGLLLLIFMILVRVSLKPKWESRQQCHTEVAPRTNKWIFKKKMEWMKNRWVSVQCVQCAHKHKHVDAKWAREGEKKRVRSKPNTPQIILWLLFLHKLQKTFFTLFHSLALCSRFLFLTLRLLKCVWVSVCFNGRILHIHKPWTGFVLCRIFSFRNIQWMKQWMQTTKHQHTTTTTITTKAINFKWKSERENTHTNTKPPLMATFRWYMACTSV